MYIRYIDWFYRLKEDTVKVNEFIAGGGYGRVYKGTYRRKKAAIKVFSKRLDSMDDDELKEITKEFKLMKSLKHRNTVRSFGFIKYDSCLALVMEYADKGPLTKWIEDPRFRENIQQQYETLLDVALGLSYIHSKNIIHRDLKPDNILIFRARNSLRIAKITDFGESRVRSFIQFIF